MNKITKDTIELFLFELMDRITRLYIHLNQIRNQFYLGEDRKEIRVSDKLFFLNSYKECLLSMLEVLIRTSRMLRSAQDKKNRLNENKYLDLIKMAINTTKTLHERLSHLPRPSEPIELRRFGRIIDKNVVNLTSSKKKKKVKKISIYVSENIGETAFSADPLTEFKARLMNDLIDESNSKISKDKKIKKYDIDFEREANKTVHISIPRIDASNPCRWPTLIHEIGHTVFNNQFLNKGNIVSDFFSALGKNNKDIVEEICHINTIELKHWLLECWCDLFASLAMGPSFWFSEYTTFIFEGQSAYSKNYPPPLFRLHLIRRILTHRFSKTIFSELEQTIEMTEKVVEFIDSTDSNGFIKNHQVRQLYIYFSFYFIKHIFPSNKGLNSKLRPLAKYMKVLDNKVIIELVNSLKEGIPVPSKPDSKDDNKEVPTLVQEILLAAWLHRNNDFKNKICSNINKLIKVKNSNKEKLIEEYESLIVKEYHRFDDSILRSIQVSEWLHLYLDRSKTEEKFNDVIEKPINESLLVDYEIIKLIRSKDLRIIPVMNLRSQIGPSSFDIRLGTSFQIFFPNQHGIIDLIDEETLRSANDNSKTIDLDFIQPIIISPGQFMLAHSMEYLRLPEYLSAELEGRSSLARLGLEIHMTAGFVDPGFEGVLTFELYNAGSNPIRLYPGLRIAQLRFFRVNTPSKSYKKRDFAKYRGLLTYHQTLQFKDYEIDELKKELEKQKKQIEQFENMH